MENQIIKIKVEGDQQLVSARDLHKALEIKKRFSAWKEQNFKDFEEGTDFTGVPEGTPVKGGNGNVQYLDDYAVTLDMAKELCMMSKTAKGKEVRQYFIQVEKNWNSPEMVIQRALEISNARVQKLQAQNKDLTLQLEESNKMEQTIKEGGLLASHLSPEEIQLKKAYIEEMRKQNDNKAHQLRNDDAKIFLQLAKVADTYDNIHLATEFRNEAISRMHVLPVGGTREYSATEIAGMLGVSPVTIGTWANKLGVKHNRNMSYRDKAGQWHYYTSAVKLMEANALEIKDYEENHIEEE